MISKDTTPTNIFETYRTQGPLESCVIVKFDLGDPGMEHQIEYHKYDSLVNGTVEIKLDGKELILKESLLGSALRRFSKTFKIQGKEIGLIKIQGYGAGIIVRIMIGGVLILKI